MSFKVVMPDTIFKDHNIENEVLKRELGIELTTGNGPEEAALIETCKDADGIVTVYGDFNRNVIEQLEKCKIIVRTGIGVNNIDAKAATEKGIYVVNVPDYCWDEVSDHAISLAFALLRQLHAYDKKVKSGVWDVHSKQNPVLRFNTLTFGLIGFGNIPKVVSKKLKPFGFTINVYDPFIKEEDVKEYGVNSVDLETLLKTSDVVSVHAPLIDATHHMLNKETLSLMKDTSIVINTARGPLINTNDLLECLKSGKIGGAGLDVLEQEPPNAEDELLKLDNVILSPHAAFYSEQSEVQLRESAFMEVVRVLKGQKPKNAVNKPLEKTQ